MKRKIKGFTLIELLATVIILAIVLLIAVPQVLNIITKTRKNAFAADAIVAGSDAVTKLNENYINGQGTLPSEGESVPISVESLNNEDLSEYTGQVIITRENGKLLPYVTMTDNKYYVCNTYIENIKESTVTTDSECILNTDSLVNKPELPDGVKPIKWDDNGNVVPTTTDDLSWYDYSEEEKKWANIETEDGSMWVWIPRYAYKITSGYHTNTPVTIEVKFLKGDSNVAYDGTVAEAVDQGNNPGSDTKFVVHPAFKFGDDELEGIWIMKFAASNNGGLIASKPNANFFNDSISKAFDSARAMETNSIYGWDTSGKNIDTHMMKDVEWGAASYLALSNYGKTFELWYNHSTTTGCAQLKDPEVYNPNNCQNAYNTVLGQNASTTGNYYGIYDMHGHGETTASYLNTPGSILSTYGSSLISANPKYVDVYTPDPNKPGYPDYNYEMNKEYYGNAIYETSSIGFSIVSNDEGDIMTTQYFMDKYYPFYSRGQGIFIDFFSDLQSVPATYSNILTFDIIPINANNPWRAVVATKKGL